MTLQTVCVADDNDDIRRLLEAVLKQARFDVVSVKDGKSALDAMAVGEIVVLVTDIVMPEMEGLDLIWTVKNAFPHIKILAISGALDKEFYLTLAHGLGADDYLPKPFALSEFLSKVVTLTRPPC